MLHRQEDAFCFYSVCSYNYPRMAVVLETSAQMRRSAFFFLAVLCLVLTVRAEIGYLIASALRSSLRTAFLQVLPSKLPSS